MDNRYIDQYNIRKKIVSKRLLAAFCLVLISAVLVSTISYAWLALSQSPEVNGVTTTLGSNGNLEIALATYDYLTYLQANDMYDNDDINFGYATGEIVHDNTLWGNLIDLRDIDYGLHVLNMRPAVLNIESGCIIDPPISVGVYGTDGRVDSIGSSMENINFNSVGFSGVYDTEKANYYAGRVEISVDDFESGNYDKTALIGSIIDSKRYGVRIAGPLDYYQAFTSGDDFSNTDIFIDGYCFAIDLLFRTNVKAGNLMIQTEPAKRVESEYEDEYSGDGSFIETDNKRLMITMKIVFADTLTGEVYALAQADIEGNLWITARTDENGVLLPTENDDAAMIKPLVQNQVSAVTAWVFVDGDTADNSAADITESTEIKLNLQFSTDEVLYPGYTDNSTNPNYPIRPEMPSISDGLINTGGSSGDTGTSDGSDNSGERYSEGLEYALINNGTAYEVIGIGTCTDTNIVIPSEYNSLPVVSIGERAFDFCDELRSAKLPDSVTNIGDWAFGFCSNITNVNIPDGVTNIGSRAFNCCYNLKNVTIPDSVTVIGSSAFYDCDSLTEIIIPGGVTTIGNWAFRNCDILTNVIISDGVKNIGEFAFSNAAVARIIIPQSVTKIKDWAFASCENLKAVYYTGTEAQWSAISISSIDNDDIEDAARRYYYSETQPTDTVNKYWHYVDGVPTAW